MKTKVMKFLQDEEGLTIVEYAVAAALISAAVIAAFRLLGDNVNLVINGLANVIGAEAPAAP
jgi:pilus assembly protein Flp/PilA